MNLEQNDRKYFKGLDGLRGISCLIVVITHNFGFNVFYQYGWLGVDLFFVISGFLITNILLDTVSSKNYLKNFYVRRVLRIFPLYYLLLVIFILILPQFYPFKDSLQYFTHNQWWFWLYAQNWLFIFDTPVDAKFLNHFWSLAVEEQFYLFWPLIVLWLKKPKKLIIFMLFVLIGLLLVRSLLWNMQLQNLNYTVFYRFTRIDGICIGCLMALTLKSDSKFISNNIAILTITLACINFLFYFLNRSNNFNFPYLAYVGFTTFSAMLGLLVNEIMQEKSKILNRLFSFYPFRFVGKISYGLYVFHWPIFLLTYSGFNRFFTHNITISSIISKNMASLCSTIVAFIVSIISYHFFELKFLKLKEKFS
jgi:peptidoglycan/LPS O-acetylase OafA/YrhL